MQAQWIARWIVNPHNPNLIVFFNGWGMDQRIVSHLRIEADSDVLMVYDYGDLTLADSTIRAIRAYPQVDVLAWSMGVWAYTTVQGQLAVRIRKAIALNGTPRPIDDAYGIPKAVYDATVQQFSETSRQKFFQRMCGDVETMHWFALRQPHRLLDEQRQELLAIQSAVARQQHCRPHPRFEGLDQDGILAPPPPKSPPGRGKGWVAEIDDKRSVKTPPLPLPGGDLGGGENGTGDEICASPDVTTPFTCALISRRDRIIPAQHQLQYWQGTVDYTLIDAPHCAFRCWNSWKEIFNNVTTN